MKAEVVWNNPTNEMSTYSKEMNKTGENKHNSEEMNKTGDYKHTRIECELQVVRK